MLNALFLFKKSFGQDVQKIKEYKYKKNIKTDITTEKGNQSLNTFNQNSDCSKSEQNIDVHKMNFVNGLNVEKIAFHQLVNK